MASRSGICVEVGEGDLVLGLDPGLGLGGVVVLEPAVGVGDRDAVEVSTTSSVRVGGR